MPLLFFLVAALLSHPMTSSVLFKEHIIKLKYSTLSNGKIQIALKKKVERQID